MSVAQRIAYINPLIKVLKNFGGRASREEVYQEVAKMVKLSQEDRDAEYEHISKFEFEIGLARFYAQQENLMDDSLRCAWALTQKGFLAPHFSEADLKEMQKRVDGNKGQRLASKAKDAEEKPKRTWSRKPKTGSPKTVAKKK